MSLRLVFDHCACLCFIVHFLSMNECWLLSQPLEVLCWKLLLVSYYSGRATSLILKSLSGQRELWISSFFFLFSSLFFDFPLTFEQLQSVFWIFLFITDLILLMMIFHHWHRQKWNTLVLSINIYFLFFPLFDLILINY